MVFAELNDLLQHMSLHMGERNSTAPVEALLSPPSLSSSSPVKKGGKRTDADSLATANGTVNESPSRLSCSSKGRRTKEKEGVSAMMHHQRPNQQVPLPTVNPLDRSSSYEGEGTTSRVPAVASSHTFEPLDQRTKLMLGSSTSMAAMVCDRREQAQARRIRGFVFFRSKREVRVEVGLESGEVEEVCWPRAFHGSPRASHFQNARSMSERRFQKIGNSNARTSFWTPPVFCSADPRRRRR